MTVCEDERESRIKLGRVLRLDLYFSRVEEFCTHAFAYVYFFSLDDSIFFGRISFPCVLCFVCVTELPRFRQQQWRRRWLLSPGATNLFFFLFCLACLFTFLPTYWGDILESDIFIGLCRWWYVSSSRRPFFSLFFFSFFPV